MSAFAQVSLVAGHAGASALAVKIFTIFEATSEIQRMIIGRAVTGPDVRLSCTDRVNAGAKARPHLQEVT